MLEAGSIGKVSAQIPWANLLTAPLALSLSSLSLTFVHSPRVTSLGPHSRDDLAESVASMAESFVHDELSAREYEVLRDDLNIDHLSYRQPPGSIDPFLSTEDLDSPSRRRGYDEGSEARDVVDPSAQGVSLIATLIERLFARFEFDASDLNVRLILPRKAEFILRLGQVTYGTETPSDPSASPSESDDGEVRVVKLSRFTISIRDIQSSPTLSNASRRHSASPENSSSSEGSDEAMTMLSQSLVSLPPPSTRSISPDSSMYRSATSSVRSPSPETVPEAEATEPIEEKILSLGQGTEFVVFRLVTPRLVAPALQVEYETGIRSTGAQLHPCSEDKIRLTVTIGPVAIAVGPKHARSVSYLSSALTTVQSADDSPNISQDPPAIILDVAFHIKSITLLLRPLSPFLSPQLTANDPIHDFFLGRSPTPRTPHLHVHLNSFKLSFTIIPHRSKQVFKASLEDLSMFAVSSNTGRGWIISPVLVSDPNLSTQYEPDTKYPSFEVVDWTKLGGVTTSGKVSQWRVRPLHGKRKSVDKVPSSATRSPSTSQLPALQARFEFTTEQPAICEVDVVPLHVFVDVGILEGAIEFLAIMTASPTFTEQGSDRANYGLDVDETPPATPRAKGFARWQEGSSEEEERRRLEDLIISDFTVRDDISTATSVNCIPFINSSLLTLLANHIFHVG